MKTLSLIEMEDTHGGRRVFGISSCGWAIIGTVAVTGVAAAFGGPLGGFLVGKALGTIGVIASCGSY